MKDLHETRTQALGDYLTLLEPLHLKSGVQSQARKVLLSVIDSYWLKQLENMAKLKEGINLRSYGQEDPLRTYNKEGYELFTQMYNNIERDASMYLARILRPLTQVTKGVKNHA